ncbi:gamma-glutamyltransferase [Corallincola holothuriorum]|uniref:Glutathione hydrolase proenzyme n=1 Tax=Corallincola holothuriorum TaxID=2282215 RepID=A0A368NTY5_9GAMM|nr:gamma-glutamyltransferase [Corallincola holothuriorum]
MNRWWLLVVLLFPLGLLATPLESQEQLEPEKALGLSAKTTARGSSIAVATANKHASEAAMAMLKAGGSAVDAAIAAQMVLTLVEPQSSGIGGGAFMLHYDAKEGALTSLDGRESAPQAATPDMFLLPDGKPMAWKDALVGGRSVGVPGVVAMLKMAHDKHGVLPWKVLFEPAIKLAKEGFIVSPRLAKLVAANINPGMGLFESNKAYFFPDGKPIAEGSLLVNQPLADTLTAIAEFGPKAFYQGELARRIAYVVNNAKVNPGLLSEKDLNHYTALERTPICGLYRGYKVCGMAPPSSGGVAVLQLLKLLEGSDLQALKPTSADAVHLFTQASKLAFADRNIYMADSDFVAVPVSEMLDDRYIELRQGLITGRDDGVVEAGQPVDYLRALDASPEFESTSHLSIVDKRGNAVSMTTSIEMGFGSSLMVAGFLLNNQLTDFSLQPTRGALPVANRIEPGKRPRSSMAPTMVFRPDGRLWLVIGSPGGSRIIDYVAWSLLARIDWDMALQQAIDFPRVTNRNDYTALEKGTEIALLKKALEVRGHRVRLIDLNSGIHAIEVGDTFIDAAADPRREGLALAE